MKKQKLEIAILEENEDLSNLREGDLVYAKVDERGSVVKFMFYDIAVYGGTLRMPGEEKENKHVFIYTSNLLDANPRITVLAAENAGHVGCGVIYGFNALNLEHLPEYNEDRIRFIKLAHEALTK